MPLPACCDVQIRTSAEVRTVDAEGTVTIGAPGDAGESVRGDVVIGADGVWSAVRGALWPHATVRSTGMLGARLIGRLTDPGNVQGGETWGRGDYAGVAPLPDGRLYAYLVAPVTSGVPSEPGEALGWFQQRFASWHYPLPQLLASVEPSQLLVNELFDLAPLDTLVHGRTVLVGDAAHAMPRTLDKARAKPSKMPSNSQPPLPPQPMTTSADCRATTGDAYPACIESRDAPAAQETRRAYAAGYPPRSGTHSSAPCWAPWHYARLTASSTGNLLAPEPRTRPTRPFVHPLLKHLDRKVVANFSGSEVAEKVHAVTIDLFAPLPVI